MCACAVLESHHTFTMFNLLRMPQYNILSNLKVCVCIVFVHVEIFVCII
jgi:hypothetical protein